MKSFAIFGSRGVSRALMASFIGASIAMAGCANMSDTQKGTVSGAGIGAGAGALLGALAGQSGKSTARGAVVGTGLGALGGYVWSKRMEDQKAELAAATRGTGVSVSQTADNRLKVDIPSDISFDTGRAEVKSNFQPVLDRFAQSLRGNADTDLRIVGHTDSSGSDTINDPLSIARAGSTRDYLVARGIAGQRIQIEGRGSHEPIAANTTEINRARNRRVEIFVGEHAPAAQAAPAPQVGYNR